MAETKEFKEFKVNVENTIVPEEIERTERVYKEPRDATNQFWVNGKRIYREVVDFGALPNATTATVNMELNLADLDEIVDLRPIFDDGKTASNDCYVGNVPSSGSGRVWWRIDYGTPCAVYCNTDSNFSSFSARVIVEYTRSDKP